MLYGFTRCQWKYHLNVFNFLNMEEETAIQSMQKKLTCSDKNKKLQLKVKKQKRKGGGGGGGGGGDFILKYHKCLQYKHVFFFL